MEKHNKTILDVIGNTPIVKLRHAATGVPSNIYVKLEYLNPGGSIKDRIGKYICTQAMERGELKPGGIIIEATSGNTGVGIAQFAAVNNCQAIFVMADKQSNEKIQALKSFGAQVVLCPTNVEPEDPRSYYSVAKKMTEIFPNSFYANQYHNKDNQLAHYHSTGPEIIQQTEGKFDAFIAGVGTGGTISGTGRYLKEQNPKIKVIGVDIEGSILAHYHKTGEMIAAKPYVLEGLGEDFIPSNIDFDIVDDFVVVEDEESFEMTKKLLKHEAIYTGGSGGAAVLGAIKYAKNLDRPEDILVILPDSGSRYLSKIYNQEWIEKMGYQIDLGSNKETENLIHNNVAKGVRLV
jgi:cystathionine beta-synthase